MTEQGASYASQYSGRVINAFAENDLRYWAEKWSISQDELRRAIAKVGPRAEALARYLGKS